MTTETCKECDATVEEDSGRWLILDRNEESGFDWMFLCIQCVRDWRQRGLEREGRSSKEIEVQLDREYPIGKAIYPSLPLRGQVPQIKWLTLGKD